MITRSEPENKKKGNNSSNATNKKVIILYFQSRTSISRNEFDNSRMYSASGKRISINGTVSENSTNVTNSRKSVTESQNVQQNNSQSNVDNQYNSDDLQYNSPENSKRNSSVMSPDGRIIKNSSLGERSINSSSSLRKSIIINSDLSDIDDNNEYYIDENGEKKYYQNNNNGNNIYNSGNNNQNYENIYKMFPNRPHFGQNALSMKNMSGVFDNGIATNNTNASRLLRKVKSEDDEDELDNSIDSVRSNVYIILYQKLEPITPSPQGCDALKVYY